MSKAFTKESDGDLHPEVIPEPRDLLPPGARNYVTPEGARALKDELRRLDTEIRSSLAGPEGNKRGSDLSPKGRQEALARRIRFLQGRLSNMVVVDPKQQEADSVHFGATVTVADEEGAEKTYQIVGVDESNPLLGKVSWISPVAKALISARVGDVVILELPEARRELEILKIVYGD